MGFPCTSCPVGEYRGIVAFEAAIDQKNSEVVEDLVLSRVLVECEIKNVLFFPVPVVSEWLFRKKKEKN